VDIGDATSLRRRYFVDEGNVSAADLGSRPISIQTGVLTELAYADMHDRGLAIRVRDSMTFGSKIEDSVSVTWSIG
jgi:hypothetical protein